MRNAVDIAVNRVERNVVKIIFPARAVRQSFAERLQQIFSHKRAAASPDRFACGQSHSACNRRKARRRRRPIERPSQNPRHFGNHKRRQRGRVGKRLVKMPDQLVNHLDQIRRDDKFVMLGVEMFGGDSRVFQFVESCLR